MIDALATNLVFQPLKFSRNRLEVLIDPADTTLADRSDLRYAITLLVPSYPQSPDFDELTTLIGRERPPQTVGGVVRFDGAPFRIDEVLDGFLETQQPLFGQTGLSIVPSLTMPFSRREVVTGGQPAVATSLTRPREWVFKGGLAQEDSAGWQDHFFYGYLRDTRQFLTWQPAHKTVSPAQAEYLYFLLNGSPVPTTLCRRVEVTYADGRTEVRTTGSLSGAALYQVVCVPAGVLANGLGDDAVASYRVWLSDADNNRLSEVRSYQVDRHRLTERFVLFENSLGGFDTLCLLGLGEEATKVTRTTVERDRFGATAIDAASLAVVSVNGERSLTVSTGYFTRQAARWVRYLQELLLAKSIYLVTDKGHVPLLLTSSELVTHEDDADLLARQLTFQRTNAEVNFSELPPVSPQASRATGWRGIGFRQVLDGRGFRTGMGTPIRLRKYYLDDGSDLKPVLEKANAPGDADYLRPTPIPGVVAGSTPFPNVAISRPGTYKRTTCASGQEGGVAQITIAAGVYGGEVAGDANGLAEAAWRASDTQAYADANGACALSETYTWPGLPGGQWHVRFSQPAQVAIFHTNGSGGPADMGNTPSLADQAGAFIYPAQSNDLNFPVGDANWFCFVFGTPGTTRRVRIYKNGVLLATQDLAINNDGFELLALLSQGAAQSGALYYVKLEA